MTSILEWLESLGLAQYGDQFVENAIEVDLLEQLDHETLKEIGVSVLGHRLRILKAVRQPQSPTPAAAAEPVAGGAPAGAGDVARISQAEHRQLTVMFADLVGSTAFSQHLGLEELQLLNRAYQRSVTAAIESFGGTVARYMGDGVLAYFGYPEAHEDDAERAVRAGLAVVDAVSAMDTREIAGTTLELNARVGIATGPVVVGDLIGTGPSQEWAVVGETPNLAARAEAAAAPGAVLVTPSTYRLTDRLFVYESSGEHSLKGIERAVELWRPRRPAAVTSRFTATRARQLSPLVGRDDEFSLLCRRWQRACEGQGHVVMLSAEPGLGKSRLAEALREQAQPDEHAWLLFQCSPHHTRSPFHPFTIQLAHEARLAEGGEAADKIGQLRRYLAAEGMAAPEELDALSGLFEIPDQVNALETRQERKTALLGSLVRLVRGFSKRAPLLCVFEDLHWSDASTLEVIERIVAQADSMRALIVLTFRPEFQAQWLGHANTTLLTLSRIGRRDSVRLIESALQAAELPEDIVLEVARRADGIPLFIEELTRAAIESGASGSANGTKAGSNTVTLPETLRDVLTGRLDRAPLAKSIAQMAAVIGRDFDYDVLLRVYGGPSDELAEGLQRLEAADLVQLRGEAPDVQCRFKHALIRDAAYDSLLKARRQELHARIADVLQGHFAEMAAQQPEMMARHCEGAGRYREAVDYLRAATTRALQQTAMTEAVSHLHKAISLSQRLTDAGERTEKELELQLQLGSVLTQTVGYGSGESLSANARARELAASAGKLDVIARTTTGYAISLLSSGQIARSLELLESIPAAGDSLSAAAGISRAWNTGVARFLLGRPSEALDDIDAALARCAGLPDTPGFLLGAAVPRVAILQWRAYAAEAMGRVDTATEAAAMAVEVAEKSEHVPSVCWALSGLAGQYLGAGKLEEAQRISERQFDLSVRFGLAPRVASGKSLLGSCRIRAGDVAAGIALARAGLEEWMAGGTLLMVTRRIAWVTADLLAADAHDEARMFLDKGEELMLNRTDERCHLAELQRLDGCLRAAAGDVVEAARRLDESSRTAEQQGAMLHALRTMTARAKLGLEAPEGPPLADRLARILGAFSEGHTHADVLEARALLSGSG